MKIKPKKDEFFEGFYLIKQQKSVKHGLAKTTLALTFQDETGEIEGKLWDAQPGKIKGFYCWNCSSYAGTPKSTIIHPSQSVGSPFAKKLVEPNDPADFREKPPVDVKDTKDYLNQMIFLIKMPLGADCPCSLQ